jgi:hypothetical protein
MSLCVMAECVKTHRCWCRYRLRAMIIFRFICHDVSGVNVLSVETVYTLQKACALDSDISSLKPCTPACIYTRNHAPQGFRPPTLPYLSAKHRHSSLLADRPLDGETSRATPFQSKKPLRGFYDADTSARSVLNRHVRLLAVQTRMQTGRLDAE